MRFKNFSKERTCQQSVRAGEDEWELCSEPARFWSAGYWGLFGYYPKDVREDRIEKWGEERAPPRFGINWKNLWLAVKDIFKWDRRQIFSWCRYDSGVLEVSRGVQVPTCKDHYLMYNCGLERFETEEGPVYVPIEATMRENPIKDVEAITSDEGQDSE